jgi:transcription elongation factor GreB
MSKAFTKDSDSGAQPDDELDSAGAPPIPSGARNYMTPGCADRLKNELKKLLNNERPALVRVIEWAASNGDRSENGDYIYGKKRLREIDRRIRFLTKRLESAEVVDPLSQRSERVLFGATVRVRDESDRERVYRIVGVDEIEAEAGKVSWVSPIAKALLNQRAGDVVTLRTPRGEEELEILAVQYVDVP